MQGVYDALPEPPHWTTICSEHLDEFEMFRIRRDRICVPKNDEERDIHVVESPSGVAVLATTADDRFVLVTQFRQPLRQVTLEVPSGALDDGEDVASAGARELREETGYEGDAAESLGLIDLNPSWQVTLVHVVWIRNACPSGEKQLDAAEDTRVVLMTLAEVREMVRSGRMNAGVSLSALALLTLTAHGVEGAASRSCISTDATIAHEHNTGDDADG